jgi:hypothetical protein
MTAQRRTVSLLALLAATACSGFGPPRAITLASLQPLPLARLVPGRFELELRSPGLTGTFDAVVAATAAGDRLQLFPDVGGKVLDLTFTKERVVGELPGSRYEATAPLDRAPPHLALALAAVAAELLAPVSPDRVLAERERAGATELLLLPALGAGSVQVRLDPTAGIASYCIQLGGLDLQLAADGTLTGRGVTASLRPPPPIATP